MHGRMDRIRPPNTGFAHAGIVLLLLGLLSSLSGCQETPILFSPHLATADGTIFLAVQTRLQEDQPGYVLLRAATDSPTRWDEDGRYRGRVAGLFGSPEGITLVFADGTVVAGPTGKDATIRVQGDVRLRFAAAAKICGVPHAVDTQEPGQLQVMALRGLKWETAAPPLAVVGQVSSVQVLAWQDAPLLLWHVEIGGRRESGLRLARFTGAAWEQLPAPPRPQRGFFAAAADASGIFLVREPDGPLGSETRELLLARSDGRGWNEMPSGLPLPQSLREAQSRGLATVADTGQLLVARADATGTHVFVALDAAGTTWTRAASPLQTGADSPWLALPVLLLLLFGLGLTLLNRYLLRRSGLLTAQSVQARRVGTLASPLDRGMAMLVDLLLVMPLPLAFAIYGCGGSAQNLLEVLAGSPDERRILYWVWIAGLGFYAGIAEARWGQTVGKRLFGIRVRNARGGRILPAQALIRNALRILDFWPVVLFQIELPYLVALLLVALTPRRQRLGDVLGHTIVLRHVPLTRRTLVLASSSPRRSELFRGLGIPFTVQPPDVDETVLAAKSVEENALRLARNKAAAVSRTSNDTEVILAADTLVAAGAEIIGKPRDREEARQILRRLSGTTHRVVTGVAIIDRGTGQQLAACEQTEVEMRPLTEAEIDAYVESGEADGKAGAYAIQETGDRYVTAVRGSLSNVIGLPMELVVRMLEELDG